MKCCWGQDVWVTQAASISHEGLKRSGPRKSGLYLERAADLTAVWVQTGGRWLIEAI